MGSRKKQRKGLTIDGPFIPITHKVQDSAAYISLTGNAAKMYNRIIRVARTVAVKLGVPTENDVQFDFTYSEAKKYGFSESTTRRALKELWDKGFISVIKIGGITASDKCGRMSSKYKLCGNWQSYGDTWKDRRNHEDDPWAARSEPKRDEAPRW